MPRGLKMSRMLIIDMILFIIICKKIIKWENIYIRIFNIADWDTWDDSLAF